MILHTVVRQVFSDEASLGEWYVGGTRRFYTLEDQIREGVKVPKETAIWPGEYELRMSYSPRFKQMMPEIVNVKDFTGIRVHTGNDDDDTEGCILVGRRFEIGEQLRITESRLAYAELLEIMERDKTHRLTVINAKLGR